MRKYRKPTEIRKCPVEPRGPQTVARGEAKLSRREFGTLLLSLAALRAGTRPVAAETDGLIFAIIGDYGWGSQAELDVSNLVKSWDPEFILTNGDNNYGDAANAEGSAATIDNNVGRYYHQYIYPYKGTYGAGADVNRFFPILADKDYNPTAGYAPYLDYFTLPGHERYYDFVWGPVHFFMLNSDSQEPDGTKHPSAQSAWLQARLAASTARWKLVHIHHPPYSSNTSFSRSDWPFAQWGADVVSSGQAHVYERIHRNGIVYFINGLGGRSTGDFEAPVEGSAVRFGDDYGAQRVTATQDSITFEFFTRRGELIDTLTLGVEPAVVAAPTGLVATAVSTSQIDLGWTDNSGDEGGFEIERSADGINFVLVAAVGPNQTRYSDTTLDGSDQYAYRVRAFSGTSFSAYSNTAVASLPTLDAPVNLTATTVSDTKITLVWQDTTTTELGFEIERSQDGVNYTLIKKVAANVTTYTSASLVGGTRYYYRVRAYDANGKSAYSNVASAVTDPGKPAAPTGLTARVVSSTRIDLSWTDNSTTETGYKVYRSPDGVSFSTAKSLGPNVTSYSDTGRTPGTTYYYQVRAFNAAGNSSASNTASATTPA